MVAPGSVRGARRSPSSVLMGVVRCAERLEHFPEKWT
jgi:hypothetical protein